MPSARRWERGALSIRGDRARALDPVGADAGTQVDWGECNGELVPWTIGGHDMSRSCGHVYT